jgi:hypothetical protein
MVGYVVGLYSLAVWRVLVHCMYLDLVRFCQCAEFVGLGQLSCIGPVAARPGH